MADNLDGDIKNLTSAWEDIKIEVFTGIDSSMRSLSKNITQFIIKIGQWTQKNPKLIKTLSLATIGLSAFLLVIGSLLLMIAVIIAPLALFKLNLSILAIKGAGSLSLLTYGIKSIGNAFSWLGRLIIGHPIIAAIMLFTTITYFIYKYWDQIEPYFFNLWNTISAYTQNAWQKIKVIISEKWNDILNDIKELPAKLKQLGSDIIDVLLNGISEKWEELKNKFSELKQMAKDAITPDFFKPENQTQKMKDGIQAANAITPSGGIRKYNFVHLPNTHHSDQSIPHEQFSTAPDNIFTQNSSKSLHPFSLPATHYQSSDINNTHKMVNNVNVLLPPIEIIINSQPSQSAQDIAQEVAKQIEAIQRRQLAAQRSQYRDSEDY